jgi:hypothetical protein
VVAVLVALNEGTVVAPKTAENRKTRRTNGRTSVTWGFLGKREGVQVLWGWAVRVLLHRVLLPRVSFQKVMKKLKELTERMVTTEEKTQMVPMARKK